MRNYFTEIYKNSIMSNNNWNSRIFRLPLSFSASFPFPQEMSNRAEKRSAKNSFFIYKPSLRKRAAVGGTLFVGLVFALYAFAASVSSSSSRLHAGSWSSSHSSGSKSIPRQSPSHSPHFPQSKVILKYFLNKKINNTYFILFFK